MRASGTIDYSPIDIWRCLNNTKLRLEWDRNADHCQFLSKVGTNAYTFQQRSKKIFTIASREFIFDFLTNQEPDGTIFIVTSTNEDLYDKVPRKDGVIRAYCPVGGWIITPDKNDPNKSHVKLIIELDFGGNIPDIAVKTAFREQGYQIEKLKNFLPRFKSLTSNKPQYTISGETSNNESLIDTDYWAFEFKDCI